MYACSFSTERRQRVALTFILNNFLMKTAFFSNDMSRVQMVVRDGADEGSIFEDGKLGERVAHLEAGDYFGERALLEV